MRDLEMILREMNSNDTAKLSDTDRLWVSLTMTWLKTRSLACIVPGLVLLSKLDAPPDSELALACARFLRDETSGQARNDKTLPAVNMRAGIA